MADIYDKYYWQNDKVRIRATCPDDDTFIERLDSEAWAMASEEMTLPPVKKEDATDTESRGKEALVFSIEDIDGNYIGDVRFNDMNERHGTCEIGVSIWRDYRGKGYGKAALEILLDYAFNERRLNKCNADCIDCNAASISLMKALGFQLEGTIREVIFFNGVYRNKLMFGLTASEYKLSHRKQVSST